MLAIKNAQPIYGNNSLHAPATIEKIENFGKTFDQLTNETVKAF